MKKTLIFGIILGTLTALIIIFRLPVSDFIHPIVESEKKEKPLEQYTFARLRQTHFSSSYLEIGDAYKTPPDTIIARLFYFTVDGKKVSGLLTLPEKPGNYPIIIMLRGYVDQEIYTTGIGTKSGAFYFAQNGFIVVSPDFLGYGESDDPSEDVLEARFQTYVTAITLLHSLENLDEALSDNYPGYTVDENNIAIWGHSNGGHIALALLEITGGEYPTTLWAPVTQSFPKSVLHYVDDEDENGRILVKKIHAFTKEYNAQDFDPSEYYDWIKAPLQLHQGTEDDAVPVLWSDAFVKTMKSLDKKITYYMYEGDDHNFKQGSWNTVIQRDVVFFNQHLY